MKIVNSWTGMDEEIGKYDRYDGGERIAQEQAIEMERRGFGDEWLTCCPQWAVIQNGRWYCPIHKTYFGRIK